MRYDDALAQFRARAARCRPKSRPAPARAAFALADCLAEGAEAGREAAKAAGFEGAEPLRLPETVPVEAAPIRPLWIVPGKRPLGHGNAKHFVDFQNDATAADVMLASREGYQSIEHLKRYTTTGMGTDQGKTSNVNALAILSQSLAAPTPAGRHDDLQAALYTRHLWHAGGP